MLPETSKAQNIADILSEEFNKFKLDMDQGFKQNERGNRGGKTNLME